MFGNLFNEIQVERYDADGIKQQTISVPIEYSPKQKFVQRVLNDPTLNRPLSVSLPRMGFEFTSINYAPQRKLNSAHKIVKGLNTGGNDFNYTYTPVPYDINFSLYALLDMQKMVRRLSNNYSILYTRLDCYNETCS